MSILEELIAPLSLGEFQRQYLFQQPYASPGVANRFRKLISWRLLQEIFANRHDNCWLPKSGRLPDEPALKTGCLTIEMAQAAFAQGRTVLVRHAEQAHPEIAAIASDFQQLFDLPIDIQLYCTPAEQVGFDWHYDIEEVFVIQSAGEKEFTLRKNRSPHPPTKVVLPKYFDAEKECVGPEIRCLLKAGDWLYIPAGWWHKAQALTDSFHLSVGVLAVSQNERLNPTELHR